MPRAAGEEKGRRERTAGEGTENDQVRTTATRRRDRKGREKKRPSRRATVMRRRFFASSSLSLSLPPRRVEVGVVKRLFLSLSLTRPNAEMPGSSGQAVSHSAQHPAKLPPFLCDWTDCLGAVSLGSPPTLAAAVFLLALCPSCWFFVGRRGGEGGCDRVSRRRWPMEGRGGGAPRWGQNKERGTVKMFV